MSRKALWMGSKTVNNATRRQRESPLGEKDIKRSRSLLVKLVTVWTVYLLLANSQLTECLVEKWTVGIPGDASEADRVADEHGCKNLGLVRGFTDVYLFEKVSTNSSEDPGFHRTKRMLEAHSSVAWVDPQTPQKRVKRDALPTVPGGMLAMQNNGHQMNAQGPVAQSGSPGHILGAPTGQQQPSSFRPVQPTTGNLGRMEHHMSSASVDTGPFNDELWTHQWYLQDNSNVAQMQSDIGLNVEDVWKMGFTGKGVVVSILDDGLEWNHTDIKPNYDARASWDMNNNRSNPFPRYDSYDSNSHGTRCAGEIAMVANNRKCGVGVAPQAKIGGIKCLDGEVADHIESMSLLHNIDYIDIYSGSWGPSDNGQVVDGQKRLASQALERGTKFGRQGKGALYVWANGNGGALGDNCNCDGYVNSIYTISIGGVTQQGQIPFYGERCSSTLAVTCSSGAHTDRKIVTTDLHNKCTIDYTGTSAAAPLAAGVYALMLEANRNITWRDAQHLTAWTSNPIPLRDNPGWKRNAAGFIFNSRFGFGLLNAKAMVDAALKWHTVPKKSICVVSPTSRLPVLLQSRNIAHVVFVSDGCQREYESQQKQLQQQAALGRPNLQRSHPTPVIYLEHVQLIIDVEYTTRGNLDIFIISPAGTVSTLLSRRPLDASRNGFDKWPLMSVHFWGETSFGKWTVIVRDKDSQHNRGLLRNATLVLHGTTNRPHYQAKAREYDADVQAQSFLDPVLELDEDDIYDLNTFPNEMSLVRDDSFQPTFIKSVIAMEKANSRQ